MSEFTHESPARHAPVTASPDASTVRGGRARVRMVLQVLGAAAGVAILWHVVAQADAASTWRALSSAGPLVLTALVPFAVGMTIDAWGTVVLLRALGHPTTLRQMLPVRFATEALHVSVPAGFVASDGVTALLLQSRCGVPVRDGIVASIARKWLVMRAHAGYIALGAVAGFPALLVLSPQLTGGGAALPWIVLGSALVPLGLSVGVGAGLLGNSTFARLHAVLARLPSLRLRRWLETRKHEAHASDAQVKRLRAARSAELAATASFFACWCVEALESALLLYLVGGRLELASIFAVEAGLSMVRSVVVLAPSGFGVVDFGYATVVQSLGVDPSAAAAFVLIRRAKEAAWVAFGYGLLALMRGRAARAVAEASPTPAPVTAVALGAE